jgi:hypothetical protein
VVRFGARVARTKQPSDLLVATQLFIAANLFGLTSLWLRKCPQLKLLSIF